VALAAMVETNVTASPMLMAEDNFLDTPTKGQIPRKLLNTILLTTTEEINSKISFIA
jgi:hypothetical protein